MNQPSNQKVKSLNNFNFYSDKISTDHLNKIKKWCGESKNLERHNNRLAGFIQDQYLLDDESKDLVLPYIYDGANTLSGKLINWYCSSAWVNYQKKYEVNPLHSHTGQLSFVMWINIPYDLNEELNLPYVKDSTLKHCATAFTLVCGNNNGTIRQLPFRLDKTNEGEFIIFPAELFHMVYPFYTSDGYRISIAGNLKVKN